MSMVEKRQWSCSFHKREACSLSYACFPSLVFFPHLSQTMMKSSSIRKEGSTIFLKQVIPEDVRLLLMPALLPLLHEVTERLRPSVSEKSQKVECHSSCRMISTTNGTLFLKCRWSWAAEISFACSFFPLIFNFSLKCLLEFQRLLTLLQSYIMLLSMVSIMKYLWVGWYLSLWKN